MRLDFSALEGFEWDDGNLGHIKKHDVNFRECEEIFLNRPLILSPDDTHSQQEAGFRVSGQSNGKRLLFLIFTIRDKKIRVLSARIQSRKERKIYQMLGGEKR